jgi:hypothetical protein
MIKYLRKLLSQRNTRGLPGNAVLLLYVLETTGVAEIKKGA